MTSIFGSARETVYLYLMKRRQFDNHRLRMHFKTKYAIDVGLYSYGCFDRWRMRGPMKVGRYCSIANTVRTVLDNHPIEALTTHPILYEKAFGIVSADKIKSRGLLIEDDVWIGHNAVILPGCKIIGRGSIIGAGSIVTHDVERYTVVAGNPARKIRDRFSKSLATSIEATAWWTLDIEQLSRLYHLTPNVLTNPNEDNLVKISDAVYAIGPSTQREIAGRSN